MFGTTTATRLVLFDFEEWGTCLYTSDPLNPSLPFKMAKNAFKTFYPCGAYYYALSVKKSGLCVYSAGNCGQ